MKIHYKPVIEEMPAREVAARQRQFKKQSLPKIDVLDFVYDEKIEVDYVFPELTAVCPMTGLPDQYTVSITYTPARKIPELKSLRNYFLSFRDLPVLHEHLACRIHADFKKAIKPAKMTVELDVAVRGGIRTRVTKS